MLVTIFFALYGFEENDNPNNLNASFDSGNPFHRAQEMLSFIK
jgi:hypothetical protein